MTDTRATSCAMRITIAEDQARWLGCRPQLGHMVDTNTMCELETGHPGPHAGLGQQARDGTWWVRWMTPEIVDIGLCPVEDDAPGGVDGEYAPCLLFEGHPGRHSFELT